MQGMSALTPGNPGPGRSDMIGIAIRISAMARAISCAHARRSTGRPGVATSPPIRNSQARGGLMKKAAAEWFVRISQTLDTNDASTIAASAIGSATRPPRIKRNNAHSNSGRAR